MFEIGPLLPTEDELERLAFALNVSPPPILMKSVLVEPVEPVAEERAV